jgi:hypothetical protein
VIFVDSQFVIIMQGSAIPVVFKHVAFTTLVLRYVPTVKRDFALDVMVMETACVGVTVVKSVPVIQATARNSSGVTVPTVPSALNVMLKRRSLRRRMAIMVVLVLV